MSIAIDDYFMFRIEFALTITEMLMMYGNVDRQNMIKKKATKIMNKAANKEQKNH